MKTLKLFAPFFILVMAINVSAQQNKYVMVVHGGAGTILKKNMTPEKEKIYIDALTQALKAGYTKIQAGKTGLNAVEAAIHILENDPYFNAGKELYLPMMVGMNSMQQSWLAKPKWLVRLPVLPRLKFRFRPQGL